MEKYTIQAPFNGALAAANITEGTVVRVGQKLGDFMNTWSYELEAAINEEDIELLDIGSSVKLKSDNSKETWVGKVSRISKVVDPGTQTIKVFISTSGNGLKEGMYLTGQVNGRKVDQAVEIPRTLLLEDNKVFVIENSALKMMEVDPIHYTTQTVVLKGLPDGTVLLDESIAGGYEGMEVTTY